MTKLLDNVAVSTVSEAISIEGTRASFQIACSPDFTGSITLEGSLNIDDETPIFAPLTIDITDPTSPVEAVFTGSVGIFNLEVPRSGTGIRATSVQTAGTCTVILSADTNR